MIESQIESKNFIGGEWVAAGSGEVYEVTNPANLSETLGTTPKSGEGETKRAIEAAAKALPEWKAMLPSGRGAILMKVADIIESQAEELALLMAREVGRSEEHTSELQSRQYLVCRLLLEKKKQKI